MYLTEKEIFSQYEALDKTIEYITRQRQAVKEFMEAHSFKSLTFIGCGSSYSLCQSAEMSAKIHLGIPANALAAGDLMVNFVHYGKLLKDTVLVAPSRSGSTSEVLMAVQKAREAWQTPCISLCAREGSELSKTADLNLEIPWAFDESVCQTRTVTNLYTALLGLIALVGGRESILKEIRQAVDQGEEFMQAHKEALKNLAQEHSWDKVVVLADSELQGIAHEGSIAFKEIPQIPSNYYHVLDVRHGPMVLIDKETLVIMACSPLGISYQQDLVRDIRGKGALVVTVGSQPSSTWHSQYHVRTPEYENYGVMGIPFIFVPQVLGYYKALARGINPDLPQGLDPWIRL